MYRVVLSSIQNADGIDEFDGSFAASSVLLFPNDDAETTAAFLIDGEDNGEDNCEDVPDDADGIDEFAGLNGLFHLLLHCPLVRSGTRTAIAFQFFLLPNCLTAAVNNESSSRVHLLYALGGSDEDDDDE